MAIWNWDLITNKIICSDNLEAVFGLEKGTFNYTYQAFISYIHPHDLQEPLRKIKSFGDRLKTTCGDMLTEQRHDYLERMQNANIN